jgi:vacuolar-type H+-ATPase subunit B/Vma2
VDGKEVGSVAFGESGSSQTTFRTIATGIAGIDLNNTLVTGQKIPFFADPDQP